MKIPLLNSSFGLKGMRSVSMQMMIPLISAGVSVAGTVELSTSTTDKPESTTKAQMEMLGSQAVYSNRLHPVAVADRTVKGKVTDANGETLPGVSVLVKGTQVGTTTNLDGNFELNVPSGTQTLVFSFVGYTAQEVSVGNRTNVTVTLREDQRALEEVVVIGYGVAKKKDLTGSISQIDSKTISVQSNSTVTRALEGVVPGVQVSAIDGQPGLDMGIRLRGAGSTSQNSSNALIVIDGVPAEYPNALASINPKDIESISVLKDAASTAVYGSRGANGVVLVTTKRGTKGKTNISIDTKMGVNYLGNGLRHNLMENPKDIYEHAWRSIYNSARYGVNGTSSTDGQFTTNVQNPNMSHEDAALFASQHLFDYAGSMNNFSRNALGNWMLYDVPGANYTQTGSGVNASATMSGAYLIDPTTGKLNPNARQLFDAGSYRDHFFEKQFRQEHTINASGGSDKMDYFVSLGMLEDPSYIAGSKFKRYNLRSNVNANITEWLKVGANIGYGFRNTQSPATRFGRNPGSVAQNVFRWANGQSPLVSLFARDEAGNILKNADGSNMVHSTAGMTYTPLGKDGQTSGPLSANTDLITLLDKDIDRRESHDLNLKGYLTVNFLKDFSFTNSMSYDRFAETRMRYGTPETGTVYNIGSIGREWRNTGVLNTQQLLNYTKGFDKHFITALAGHEYYQWNSEQMNWGSAYSLVPDFYGYSNFVARYNTSGSPFSTPGGSIDKTAMESFFARATYNYDDRYFLEGSIRRDGSSKFRYKENRWGTFWSIGGGWRISAEDFMEGARDWVSDLKVRASYGVIGNQSGIGNYSGYQTWSYGAVYQSSNNGTGVPASFTLSQGAFVNSALTWENTNTFDVGVDFSLFKKRVNGNIDFYNKLTTNSVFAQPIATSLGQSSLTLNSAKLLNRGVEVMVNVDVIKNKDWNWNVGLNGTHYRTILKSVPTGITSPALGNKFTAGVDGWGANGGGSVSNIVYLRGENTDFYNMYLYKYAGVDQMTGLPMYHHTVTAADHGASRFTDAEVGSIVNTTNYTLADRYEMGSAIPKWIGGFNTNLRYKNFDFTAILAYQLGGKFFSVEYANHLYRSGTIGSALSADLIGNTWTPENPNAEFPMVFYGNDAQYTAGTTHGGWLYSDKSLFSASYLNVKNLTLGYTVNSGILNKLKLKSVRVYASADNVAMFTAQRGIDPRMSLVGGMEVGTAVYAPMSTFSVGVNVNL